jgi:hypothetical protein
MIERMNSATGRPPVQSYSKASYSSSSIDSKLQKENSMEQYSIFQQIQILSCLYE